MADELVKVMLTFSDEPQNGDRLQGLSPAEAWKQLSPKNRRHDVLPDSLRYLLSNNKSEQKVTNEGIKLRIGNLYNYYVNHPRLGELRDEKVQVYYNDNLPEQVIVIDPKSDPKGQAPFSVPLFERVPATTATAEQFAEAKRHQQGFSRFGKETYRLISPPTNKTIQDTELGSEELRGRGAEIHRLEKEYVDLRIKRAKSTKEIKSLAASQGLHIDPAVVRNPTKVTEALNRVSKAREAIRELEAQKIKEGNIHE